MKNIKSFLFPIIIRIKPLARFYSTHKKVVIGYYHNISASSYAKKKKLRINVEEPASTRKFLIPDMFVDGALNKGNVVDSDTPAIFSTVLCDVYVFNGCNTMFIDGYAVNEKFSYPYAKYISFCSYGGGYSKNTYKKTFFSFDKQLETIEEGINIFGEASGVFYHFINDILSTMAYVNNHPEFASVPLLIDAGVKDNKTYLELLETVNIHKHPIVFIDKKGIFVKKLYYFSPATWSNVMPRGNDAIHKLKNYPYRYVKNETVIEMYRCLLIPKKRFVYIGKRIFVRRGHLSRMNNEDEVCSLLKENGFDLVDMEKYSIYEQTYIFNNAEMIVAEEGSALINLMWCSKGCKLIMITPRNWVSYTFSSIALLIGVDATYYLSSECNYNDRKHTVDINDFKILLNKVINNE